MGVMDFKADIVERVSFISASRHKEEEAYVECGTPLPDVEYGGALRPGSAPNLWSRDYIGVVVQYAAIGIIYGTLPGTVYPFLLNYLNMEGTQVLSAQVLLTLPWSFKVFNGILSDCFPIFGYRRRPFMIVGWAICAIMLFIMASMSEGSPYYKNRALLQMSPSEWTHEQISEGIDASAPDRGAKYIVLMMLAAVGYVGADAAADGIVVELAQREPDAVRGWTQITIYMVRMVFVTLANILTGFAFNGNSYGGDFDHSISVPTFMLILGIVCVSIIPVTWFFIKEERSSGVSVRQYMREFWGLLQQRVVYQVVAYKFFSGLFESFPATPILPMQAHWAKATPLNDKFMIIVGNLVFALVLFATGKWGLQWNWRWMHAITVVLATVIDAIPVFLTTWDVIRNQWFWLGVPVVEHLPSSMGFIIGTFILVELADEGNEGAVYGLLSTAINLSVPFASTITKTVDAHFDVSNADILEDTNHVRWQVTYVMIIRYSVNLLGLLWLPLLPAQRKQTQELKLKGGRSKVIGGLTVLYLVFALCWTVLVNLLSIYESTKCLEFVGGTGC